MLASISSAIFQRICARCTGTVARHAGRAAAAAATA
jgi:hypothetical protein